MGIMAIDAATQCQTRRDSEVTLVYRRTQEEIPCTEHEVNIAKLDGCNIIWLASPKEIIGENGAVKSLVCDVMKLGEPDSAVEVEVQLATGETIHHFDVDMVIKAAGQMPFSEIVARLNIQKFKWKLMLRISHQQI